MIMIRTNINAVVAATKVQLASLADTDKMLRTIGNTVLFMWKDRIHVKGLDAMGKPIGTYSAGYMKIRTGDFKNSGRVSRGKSKGKLKNAGVFTDRTIRLNKGTGIFSGEDKVGKPRPKYNRSSESKVILSLTREMENDMKVVAVGSGYGIGFSNPHNFNKSQWAEATYNLKGRIYTVSKEETEVIQQIANKHRDDAFS